MAGRGGSVAPKDPAQRRRYNQPARGEWVDLEPLEEPILCGYDEMRFTIPVWLWQAWRADAVTSQYGEADMGAIELLAVEWDGLQANEQRLRMDSLGLTPKGKRDLRWRTPNEVKTIRKAEEKAKVLKLHAVGKTKS